MHGKRARRDFIRLATSVGAGLLATPALRFPALSGLAPAIITQDAARPQITSGVQCGDVTGGRAIIWSRADRPARLLVEYDTVESFRNPLRVHGPVALETTDYTARLDLNGLPAGQRIFYRVRFQDLGGKHAVSEPVTGSFNTPPADRRDVSFVWGGDVVGQGWGINPDFGGMKIFEQMRRQQPDFFIHSGDTIYADGEVKTEVTLPEGGIWKNIVTPEKAKVAETLNEFRGNHRYNLLDENLRRFNGEVPVLAQWDDHETRNNWYPGQIIDDNRYTVKNIDLLAARGQRAFMEYLPLRFQPEDPERIYRAMSYGPLVEVFMLDQRSYRGPNTANRQTTISEETAYLGAPQMEWLKARLAASRAVWKVIASDMPIGLVVADGRTAFENCANGDGPALGRELEVAELLRFIKQRKIHNTVWLTADVHYAAAHYYDPAKAQFPDFLPFWEFVAGPLNAGTFGPGKLDNTFGPEAKFISLPAGFRQNSSPAAGLQFFGRIGIEGKTQALTASLHNIEGKELFRVSLAARNR
ncbi:MAG: alkaline phosphatase D family protein [Blastocatellia bacterium]